MSSLSNAINRRAHKERVQLNARTKFGLLEKHKDYIVRAKGYHKEEILQKLREKAAFRKPYEFHFKMIKTRTVDGVNKPEPKTWDIYFRNYRVKKWFGKFYNTIKKVEKLTAMLHSLDNHPSNGHIYYTEDREEAKEIRPWPPQGNAAHTFEDLPDNIKRKTAASYGELVARKSRASELQKLYMEMALKSQLQKNDQKRKLHEHEIISPTSRALYKWRSERER